VIALEMLTAGAREMVGEAMIVRIFVVSACEASDAAARAAEPSSESSMNAILHRLTGVAEGKSDVPVQMCDAQYTCVVTLRSSLCRTTSATHGEHNVAARFRRNNSLPSD